MRGIFQWTDSSLTFWAAVTFVSGLLAYLAISIPQLTKPLVYDDVPFASGALAAAATGRALGYQGWMSNLGDFTARDQWALWHPPLYVYMLALWSKLFGSEPAALRSLGLVSGVASAGLTFLLAAQVTAGTAGEKRLAGGIAAALTLVSPIYLQSVQVLDIDFPVLLPLTLLFLLLYVRWEHTSRWWWLIPVFGIMLWSKMTNPFAVLGAVLGWQFVRGQPRRVLVHGSAIGLGGATLFGITWVGIGSLVGWPLEMPFQVNLVQWRDSAGANVHSYRSFDNFVAGLRPTVIWLGPPLVVLGLTAAAVRGGMLASAWRVKRADLVLGLCVLLVLGYVNKSAGWLPKYQVALAPLLAVVAAPLVVPALRREPRSAVLAVLAAVSTALHAMLHVGDGWALTRSWQIDDRAALGLVAIATTFVAVAAAMRVPSALALVLAAVAFGWGVGVASAFVGKPYSTHYLYGTSGVEDAAAWVEAHVAPTEVYVSSKDVAWRSSRPNWVDAESLYTVLQWDRPDFQNGQWQGLPIKTIVAWIREPSIEAMLERTLPSHGFAPTERIGDFLIYHRQGPS